MDYGPRGSVEYRDVGLTGQYTADERPIFLIVFSEETPRRKLTGV